jgi:hypothetical protein
LQFGFRRRELFDRLSRLESVTCVPYEVPANVLIEKCDVSVTFTGTIGFQAALAGLCSIVTEPYYATEEHYMHVRNFSEIDGIVDRLKNWQRPSDMDAARREIVRRLVAAGAPGNYFTWRKFDPDDEAARKGAESLVRSLNQWLPQLMKR